MQLVVDLQLVAVGVFLTVYVKRRLLENSLLTTPQSPMVKRFW